MRAGSDGFPETILIGRSTRPKVCIVEDAWRLDDEWWRLEVARRYFRVVVEGGHQLVVYHDLVCDRWYAQAGS